MANRFPLVANVSSSRIAELASGDGLDLSGSDIVNAANVTVLGTSTLGAISNVKITGGTVGQVIQTDGAGNLSFITGATIAGSNTQIQFNNAGVFGASANLTFNNVSNTLTATNIVGNGSGLTSITGANVTGTVSLATSATSATTAGTVTTAAQPNITTVGTLTTLFATQYVETRTQPTISAGALTLDCSACNVFDVSLSASVTSLTVSNIPVTGRAFGFTLKLNITGSFTITWPASVKWANATAPTLTTTSGKVDVLEFLTIDNGTTIYGFVAGQNL